MYDYTHVGLILHWIYKTIFNTRVKFRFDYLHKRLHDSIFDLAVLSRDIRDLFTVLNQSIKLVPQARFLHSFLSS